MVLALRINKKISKMSRKTIKSLAVHNYHWHSTWYQHPGMLKIQQFHICFYINIKSLSIRFNGAFYVNFILLSGLLMCRGREKIKTINCVKMRGDGVVMSRDRRISKVNKHFISHSFGWSQIVFAHICGHCVHNRRHIFYLYIWSKCALNWRNIVMDQI